MIVIAGYLGNRQAYEARIKDQASLDNYINEQVTFCELFPTQSFFDLASYQGLQQ